ncbi:MAG: ferrous iron transport protein B [Cyanobacteria bacterium]|nr:ferrous iron transport protein B [Cyanobacteria bacterium CG_2015-16_32_12]NCO78443.1 ferrous iron transport protein B [Cyanobacteria bacterium CG_2015-22_32_23]NCQ04830.1 ferrous iron transport protein B [Cyanobacteria bacterium CG_2015-09_32_10]NCQ42068.1 ferrous iron transport protein B [Cyanobacteria bacterium CG_2015-04_32_10]NCS84258.1 ferrous iron transport protein B [Cyanobacteria bacterium CG_2015-02_32_10]
MNCHQPKTVGKNINPHKRVALLGMPNTGKSTFFNRLTGGNAFVGNWAGITVDLLQARVKIEDETTEFIDLPGIYDLNGFSEDEKVVQNFLEKFAVDLVIIIVNATQIDRQIRLVLQIKALGFPAILVLNMADEAKHYGVKIEVDELSQRLEIPTFLMSAKYGQNYQRVYEQIVKKIKENNYSFQINNLTDQLLKIGAVLPEKIDQILGGTVIMPSNFLKTFTFKVDSILLHPILGLPLFFLGMFLVFQIVWNIGLPSMDLMGNFTNFLQIYLLESLLKPFPLLIQDFIINGIWNGLATVASFIPLIVLFFIVMAILEDSGYLSRSAYLMDALMSQLGLDGRSFVLQMMGFGCNVPALMGTRIMRSQGLRLLTMLVITFSLCSARLQVFIFLIAATFPNQKGATVLFSLYILSFVAALVAAFLLKGQFKNKEPFVLELPPYRFPTLKQVINRGWGEVLHFLQRASGFIILGCVAVWFLTNLPLGTTGLDTFGGQLGNFLSPIMQPIGIDPYLTLSLLFGFIAKEVVVGAFPVIYGMDATNLSNYIGSTVTWVQAYSFCLFCLLYTPCLTTLATMFNESKSWKYTSFSVIFSFVFAWLVSFIFFQTASFFGFS